MSTHKLNIESINKLLTELEDHKEFLTYKIREEMRKYDCLLNRTRNNKEEILQLYQSILSFDSSKQEEKIDRLDDLLIANEEAHIQSLILIRGIADRLDNLALLVTSENTQS
ncbi:MAG: hypothetical protein AAF770_00915 [Bacteroidota bacterium]